MFKLIVSVVLLVFLIFSCDSNTEIEDIKKSITITGTVENINVTTLTDSMNIYLIWVVISGSPDYSYVWSKGTINKENYDDEKYFSNNTFISIY